MAANSDNIRGGFRGTVFLGPKGATLPINPKVAPNADFVDMGYLTDDGIVMSRSREVAREYAMGVTNAPVWTRVTSQEATVAVTFKETKAEVIAVMYELDTATMTSTAAAGSGGSAVPQFTTMIEQASILPREYSMVIDLTDGTYLYRRMWPKVQVSENGDLTYVTSASVGYSLTFETMVGADGYVSKHMWSDVPLPTAAFPGVPSA